MVSARFWYVVNLSFHVVQNAILMTSNSFLEQLVKKINRDIGESRYHFPSVRIEVDPWDFINHATKSVQQPVVTKIVFMYLLLCIKCLHTCRGIYECDLGLFFTHIPWRDIKNLHSIFSHRPLGQAVSYLQWTEIKTIKNPKESFPCFTKLLCLQNSPRRDLFNGHSGIHEKTIILKLQHFKKGRRFCKYVKQAHLYLNKKSLG